MLLEEYSVPSLYERKTGEAPQAPVPEILCRPDRVEPSKKLARGDFGTADRFDR